MAKRSTRAGLDTYSNRAFVTVTMTAVNTTTYEPVRFSVGTFQGFALRLNRIECFPTPASHRELVAATDRLHMALTARDDLASLDPTNQAILAKAEICGIGANVEVMRSPIIMDFSSLPEGALLIAPNPLYLAVSTDGAAAASVVRFVLYYQFLQLSDKESLELLQTILPGNV